MAKTKTIAPSGLTPQDVTDILRAHIDGKIAGAPDFSGKDLSGIVFASLCRRENKTDLHSASFIGANLTGCDFTGVSLQGCNFNGANLKDAIMTDCNTQYSIGL